jgi:hypothetical protein
MLPQYKVKKSDTFLIVRQCHTPAHLRPEVLKYAKKYIKHPLSSDLGFIYSIDAIKLANKDTYLVGLYMEQDVKNAEPHESVVVCSSKKELLTELSIPRVLFGPTREHVFVYKGDETDSEVIQKLVANWQNSIL